MSEKKTFFIRLGILTAFFVLIILISQWLKFFPVHPYVWGILLYNILLTVLSYFLLQKGIKGDQFEFYNRFMGNSAIRLLLSAALIFMYFYKVGVENMNFIITFFVFYFTYTIFELKYLLSNLRANSDSVHKKDEK